MPETSTTHRYYLAYGSNLNKEQMYHRCPQAQFVGTTSLEGYRLAFRSSATGNAYLTIIPDCHATVSVGVWLISPADEMALDDYEDYPSLYRKEYLQVNLSSLTQELTVTPANNSSCSCLVYIMNPDHHNPATADYIVSCRQGYDDCGFSHEPIDLALEELKLLTLASKG